MDTIASLNFIMEERVMRILVTICMMFAASALGALLGAGINDPLGGAVLFAVIAGFGCTVYTIEHSQKKK